MTDIAVAIPEDVFVTVGGEKVEIKRLKVGSLTRVMRIAAPFYEEVRDLKAKSDKDGTQFGLDVYGTVVKYSESAIEVVAVMTDKPVEWVEELELDALVAIFTAIIEVNLDFFLQRLIPLLSSLAGKLYVPQTAGKAG